jgi:beta-lactamase regulating signal transducer with metallopeptidase domain
VNSIIQFANTFPEFVLTFAVRAFALGFLCAVGLWLFRVRNSAIQYAVWRLILFAMLAMPLALAVMPAIGFPRLPAIHVVAQIERLSSPSHPEQKKQFPGVAIGAPQAAESPRSSVFTVPWALIGLAFYALVAGILISRIVLGWALMNRLARRMERPDDPRLLERVNHHCETLGLLIFPELRAGETVTVPVTFGWKNPTVLLPAGWRDWPADKLDLVLAHELSHVQRSDYLIRIASALNKSLYWFHPLSWWLDKRLTELGEHLSDDAALAAVSARRERYAEILGDFAGVLGHSLSRFKIGIAMSVAAPDSERIKRIFDHQRILCSRLNQWQKLAAFSLGISALVLVAGAQTAQVQAPAPIRPGQPVVPDPGSVPQRRRRVPPPMFSRAYVDALQGILELEPSDVTVLEHQLDENPEDFAARLKLIAYCMRADRVSLPESRSRRVGLVMWLVEHQPDSEILGSPYGVLSPDDLTADELAQAARQWEAVAGPGQPDARIFWNAANFYQQLNRPLYIASLEKAVLLAPANEHYALPLGLLYAGAILTVNPHSMYRDPSGADPEFARRATEILDTTQNPYILEPAVKLFKSEYNSSLMRGRESASIGALAQQYFQRAKTLDPDLDQPWIYPQVDPKMIGIFAPGAPPPDEGRLDFETAAKQIRRLPADAFPALPSMIREQLRNRGCLIPQQTFSDGGTSNQLQSVVQGEFFEKGKPSWAVLCSVNESSSILVFRDVADRRPEELAKSEDKNELQGAGNGRIAYSREIQPVDRKFIMDHYRGYGGPEPPPIDHQGIDDVSVGKASVIYYWYRGEWLKLQGAD